MFTPFAFFGNNQTTSPTYNTGSIPTGSLLWNVDANDVSSYPGSGSEWYNTVSNEADLLFTGSVTYSSSSRGKWFAFSTGSYFSTSNISTTVNDRTMCAWVYLNNTSSIDWLNYGRGDGFTDIGTSTIRTTSLTSSYKPSGFAPTPESIGTGVSGQWICFIGVTSGTTASLYVNGTLNSTVTGITTSTRTNRAVFSVNDINGNIGMMTIYSSSLSGNELQNYYNNTKGYYQ